MKYKKILALGLAITLSIGLVGCGTPKGNTNSTKKAHFEVMNKVTNIEKDSEKKFEVETISYDLGKRQYKQSFGKVLPYQERGVMSVPKAEGKFPVVLIAHGSHENLDTKARYDTGFQYLTEFLAARGMVAVSLDLNMVYNWSYGEADTERMLAIMNQHIASLKKANEGKEKGYGMDLSQKLDFEHVILVGHSRSGQGVFDVALDQIDKGQSIRGILSIAPAVNSPIEKYPDVTTSIIIPEFDGDVVDWQGYDIYESLIESNMKNPVELTLLKKANHNYFNPSIKPNDAKMIGRDKEGQLSREEQQDFLSNYLYDFARMVVTGDTKNTAFELASTAPNTMYGKEVSTKLFTPKSVPLLNLGDIDAIGSTEVKVKKFKDSWFYKDDEAIGFESLTFGNEGHKIREILELNWEQKGGSISLTSTQKDFSAFNALHLQVATAPANSLNQVNKPQTMSVVLKDGKGNESKVILGTDTRALEYVEGKLDETPIDDYVYRFWTHYTPLMSIRIPLSIFEKVDVKNIESVSILFDQSDSGSVMIDKLELQ